MASGERAPADCRFSCRPLRNVRRTSCDIEAKCSAPCLPCPPLSFILNSSSSRHRHDGTMTARLTRPAAGNLRCNADSPRCWYPQGRGGRDTRKGGGRGGDGPAAAGAENCFHLALSLSFAYFCALAFVSCWWQQHSTQSKGLPVGPGPESERLFDSLAVCVPSPLVPHSMSLSLCPVVPLFSFEVGFFNIALPCCDV